MQSGTQRWEEEHMSSDRNPIGRAFSVLYWMAESKNVDSTVGEIAQGVGMLPSTTHRVLSMLENEDLVRQGSNRGGYSLGPSFHRLARSAAVKVSVREITQPTVDRVRNATQETAWFATLDTRSGTMMFRALAESPHVLRVIRPLDQEVSVFRAGAAGRVGMAYLEESDLDRLLETAEAHGVTEQFKTTANFKDHIREVRELGFEVSASSTTGGMGIASAVVDSGKRLLGVLGIGLPVSRCNPEKERAMVETICAQATILATEF